MNKINLNTAPRRRRLGTALVLGVLLSTRALALDPAKNLLQYNCQTWSRQNGLPASSINSIAQTKDGYLWFGTTAGMLRFDGLEFDLLDLHSVATLHNSIVTSLVPSRSGGLWVGLERSGFGYYDGKSFCVRGGTNAETKTLNVRAIKESGDGTLWVVAEGHVGKINPADELQSVIDGSDLFTNSFINALCSYEDRQGRFWFGTANRGVFCWQKGKITRLPDPELNDSSVLAIAEDLAGHIWVGTTVGLYGYDSNLRRQTTRVVVDEVRALLADRQGVLWVGTSGGGLIRFHAGALEALRKADGLASDYVKAIVEDREGSLWVGTREGISQISDVKFPIQSAAKDPLVKDAISVAASQRGGVWIATSRGASYFDPKTKTYTLQDGLPMPYIKRVFESRNGDLYLVCGSHALAVCSGGKVVATNVMPTMVVGLAEDEHGVVASVAGDLYRAGTNYFQPYLFKNGQQPPFYWILNLAPGRDGTLWVASGNGIFRVHDGSYQHWGAAEGLTNITVGWVCEDSDGFVWAGTSSGIARLKDNQIQVINRKSGLFDDNIFSIVPDDLGNLWVDSSRGIFRVARQNMNDFADGKINHVECTVYDGTESVTTTDKTVQEFAGCKTADGRIWFPGPRGVVIIDPAHIPMNRLPPPVHIDRLHANGKNLGRSDHAIVAPGKGELEFYYSALTFIAPKKAQFRYRLKGYDKDWVDAGTRRLAFYTNLKPGQYTFQVMAANADGIWSPNGDSVTLELRPHFFQTTWFYLLCGGLMLTTLSGVYLWRVRHLTSKQQALQQARDLLEAEVRHRTAELAKTNRSLRDEVEDHKQTGILLKHRTETLEKEIEQRTRMQLEIEQTHKTLLTISHQAGMAEVATAVLHNVGNVLNSVNVSSICLADVVRKSKITNLSKIAALLRQNEANLPAFLTGDPKGKQLPAYLEHLAGHLTQEQAAALEELTRLQKNIEHIKEIVTMQQNFANVSGVLETVAPSDLVEDALKMNETSLLRHDIQIIREFAPVPALSVEKHKVLQILVNLVRNAKQACTEAARAEKRLTIRLATGGDRVRIAVTDNGVGIPRENLTRIFHHGFTTKKQGHGFGLHSGALTAKELGGALTVQSDGPGTGATFTLELPCVKN